MRNKKKFLVELEADDFDLLQEVAIKNGTDRAKLVRSALEPYLINARIEKSGRVKGITSLPVLNEMLGNILKLRYDLENREFELKRVKQSVNDLSIPLFKSRAKNRVKQG